MSKNPASAKKPSPPGSGLAIAGMFWLWGALLFWAPDYLQVSADWRSALNVLGGIALAISLAGVGSELANTFRTEAFSYWGVGLLFGVPAILLHLAVAQNRLLPAWILTAKIVVLVLSALGGPFILYGIPYLFLSRQIVTSAEPDIAAPPRRSEEIRVERTKFVFALIVGVLNLITAAFKLIARSP